MILEPSFGRGHLIQATRQKYPQASFFACEIDKQLEPVVSFNQSDIVIYGDFLKAEINHRFHCIIGNPPYVRQRSGPNMYALFIMRCYELLHPGGELIFIVPSDWLKATSNKKIVAAMLSDGSFSHIWYPNHEGLFAGAAVDVMVFRYTRQIGDRSVMIDGERKYAHVRDGLLTFHQSPPSNRSVGQRFEVIVGLVSGKEDVFRTKFGNVDIILGENQTDKYILIETYPSGNEEIDQYLLTHRPELMARKIRKFSASNWFEWGALRNMAAIKSHQGQRCIYVKSASRTGNICFRGRVSLFGAGLLCLIPRHKTLVAELDTLVEYFNSEEFRSNYTYAGRFKIGQRQLTLASDPGLIL